MSRRLEAVEARLQQLERPAAAPPPPPPWPEVHAAEQAAAALPEQAPAAPACIEAEEPAPAEAAGKAQVTVESVESFLGLAWLNRIGVVTLVLGVAFLFKYAIDNEWIGPWMRVAIGVLAGVAALIMAERLSRGGQRIFAMGITALGIATLYVSCYAAYGFYQLAPMAACFAAMAVTTAVGAWLALRYDAAAIAVLSLVGGFLTPVVLSTGRNAPWILFSYLLLLAAGAVWMRRARGWAAVEWLAFLAAAAIYAAWFLDYFDVGKRAPAAFFVLCAYALFYCSPSAAVRKLAQLGAGAGAAFALRPDSALLFTALLPMAAAGLVRQMTAAAAAGFWIPYWIHASSPGAHSDFWTCLTGITCGFALVLAYVLWGRRREAEPWDWTVLLAYSANAIAWYASSHALLAPERQAWTGLLTFAAAAIFGGAAWAARRQETLALVSGVLSAAFLTLAIPIQFGAWRISVAWVLEGVVLAFLASRLRARLPHWIAAGVLLLGMERAAFVDAQTEAAVMWVNARFFVMLWAALGGWISAALLRPRGLAAAAYVAGHAAMLAGIEMEIVSQIGRSVAPESVRSASIVAFSLVLACYGVALVSLGVVRRMRLDRLLGLTALSAVVVKLYAYDVWQLGRLFRSAAFVGLGLLLVGASYVYSRHRERISRWMG
jgi:uncharacterized membrane protein